MIYSVKKPKKWSEDLAYLFGLLLGDGSLPICQSLRPSGKYQKRFLIYFFSNSKEFIIKTYIPLFKKTFGIAPHIFSIKDKKRPLFNCRIESKGAYEFLEKIGFTMGKKAKVAKVPDMPKRYWKHLLAGLLDTDGGKKGNGFGLSTASQNLADFCDNLFKKYQFKYHSCPWQYKEHTYHQIYVNKSGLHKILKHIPLRNKEKIKFIKNNASVV